LIDAHVRLTHNPTKWFVVAQEFDSLAFSYSMDPKDGPVAGTMTLLIHRAREGDRVARDVLFEQAYPEMRQMARQFLKRNGHRFPERETVMVHLVCERLIGRECLAATDRRHFFILFGRMLHDVMVDEIRAVQAKKRGGDMRRHAISEDVADTDDGAHFDILDLREAIEELRVVDPNSAEAINLRYFCGQTLEQAAEIMGCSFAEIRQHADYGIAWLRSRLRH
jgi:RNA polymerase sigma factor (TIGR02999 family)